MSSGQHFPLTRVLAALGAMILLTNAAPALARTGSTDTLHDMIADAWANDPAQNDLTTQESGAQKRQRAARSWFAGGPSIDVQYYDDRPSGRNYNYRTAQGGLSVPLWLPGQGTATEHVAAADAQAAQTQRAVAHMAMAIRVADTVGTLLLSERHKATAQSTLIALRRINQVVSLSVRKSESVSTEAQAVSAQMALAENELNTVEEEIEATHASLDILTGHPTQPDLTGIDMRWPVFLQASGHPWTESNDPRVQAAHQAVRVASEKDNLAAHSYMPNPEIGVGVINQGQYGSPWDTQVGVSLKMPIPTDVTSVPIRTQAQSALSTAIREEAETRRTVRAEMARVQAHLRNTSASIIMAAQAAHATVGRADAMEHSWRAGETPLIEALRARMDAYNSLTAFNKAEIDYRVAIIRTVIALGYIP
ncbi:outer membrane protein TolC [Gluconobacter oxydans]|nr:TolC family protein [Gluconobacter potus]TCW25541.1 outer membrane protein TolC [Gluconobacter oxydans]